MKQPIEFTIENLLIKTKDGKMTGPMSPINFAKEMAIQTGFKFNRLARIWFTDEEIFQRYEADGLTSHDTLIIANQHTKDLWVSIWVDFGGNGLPVAMCYQSDRELLLTPIYEKTNFVRKLTEPEFQQLFDHIFTNPQILAIKQ